jgi:hypothetical protein
MASKKAAPEMQPLIFAKNYPAIITVFPHWGLLWPNALIRAGENQRRGVIRFSTSEFQPEITNRNNSQTSSELLNAGD